MKDSHGEQNLRKEAELQYVWKTLYVLVDNMQISSDVKSEIKADIENKLGLTKEKKKVRVR